MMFDVTDITFNPIDIERIKKSIDNTDISLSPVDTERIKETNLKNNISLETYKIEVENQNKILLEEMKNYDKKSEMYKLKMNQYKANLMTMELNKKLGCVFAAQCIN